MRTSATRRATAPRTAPPQQSRLSYPPRTSTYGATKRRRRALIGLAALGVFGCSGAPLQTAEPTTASAPVDAPLVDHQPGAWFDASGSLTVVGPGRRLRLVLSAPISACASALGGEGDAEQVSSRASLPFQVLAEACRDAHPTILLADEGDTASPAELERHYHEVARCAGADLDLNEGWRPDRVTNADPCPLALGLGWRLPTLEELSGLSLDDRKAIAGALFDTEVPGSFGSLLIYARAKRGELALASLGPNSSDQPPPLASLPPDEPLFGAALRCVRESTGKPPPLPVLPYAAECLREQRPGRPASVGGGAPTPVDLQKLKGWLDSAESQPHLVQSQKSLSELTQLLASPTLERLARQEREERALTERYAELAEGVDDPSVSPAERKRRREEFDHLRRRLGGQIVQSAEAGSAGRRQLGAVIKRLQALLTAASASPPKKGSKPTYEALLSRVRELGSTRSP